MSDTSKYHFSAAAAISGALAFTAALAWNDTVRTGIDALYPTSPGSSFKASLAYSIVATIIIIFAFAALRAAAEAANNVAAKLEAKKEQSPSGQKLRWPGRYVLIR